MYKIPFNRPSLAGTEQAYISEALAHGQFSGDGVFTRKCHDFLERELGVPKALLTTSCTHALEMAAMLLNIQPGDEVIVPSFTFVSTANAFVLRGAKPVFADIREDTLNIDESKIEALITPATKAIVPVHYAGVGCEMDALGTIARRHQIAVVEDNAHGLFGRYRDKFLGTFGALAAQSFHETKNISCGEGGALLINDTSFIRRAEILREKGTDRSRFFRGESKKYSWVDIGSSYLPSDLLAAFLYAQIEARDRIQTARKNIWNSYYNELKNWAKENNAKLPFIPGHCDQSYHMFFMIFSRSEDRNAMIEKLKKHEILGVFHYIPLHVSSMGQRYGAKQGDCPVAESVSERILRLPFYNDLSPSDQNEVISVITSRA